MRSGCVSDANRKMDKHVRRYATGFLHQTRIVSKRAFVAVLRNPATSIFQVLTFIVSGVLLGAFFYGRLTDGPNALQVRVVRPFFFRFSVFSVFSCHPLPPYRPTEDH